MKTNVTEWWENVTDESLNKARKLVRTQRDNLIAAIAQDEKAVITPKALAEALGHGISQNAITSAAMQGTLPFGFVHREAAWTKPYTKIPKLAVWNWFGLEKGE